MRRLSSATIPELASEIVMPGFERGAVRPGIVHLGVGAFHRAHQAVFVDDRLADGELDWGIVAASLRGSSTRDALEPQDNLYTLSLRDGGGERLRIIGSIIDTIVAPETPDTLLDALTDPSIRIVTLTVTEKGYTANLATQTLLADHPDILHDLANPDRPRTVMGFLAEAILRRWKAGSKPFALLSCDNLPSNGQTLNKVLKQFAALRSSALADYVQGNISCPSSMVDRIVPATTDEDRARISSALGMEDAWPVVAEPYFQWVIEDCFPQGRPLWEKSGVEFVEDVKPYEHMKLRMLNGSHTAIAAIGQIAGLETVADVMADPSARNFVKAYWKQAATTLDKKVDGGAYAERLLARFDNPSLRHRTVQIASDASQKIPQRILAPLRELISENAPSSALTYAIAAWIRSCGPSNEAGSPIFINDPAFNSWNARPDFTDARATVAAFMEFAMVFDAGWKSESGFIGRVVAALEHIEKAGILMALGEQFGAIS